MNVCGFSCQLFGAGVRRSLGGLAIYARDIKTSDKGDFESRYIDGNNFYMFAAPDDELLPEPALLHTRGQYSRAHRGHKLCASDSGPWNP